MSRRDGRIFGHLVVCALSAAVPAEIDEIAAYEGAKVSVTVTSQAKLFPEAHGICVTPSGRRVVCRHCGADLQVP